MYLHMCVDVYTDDLGYIHASLVLSSFTSSLIYLMRFCIFGNSNADFLVAYLRTVTRILA